MAGNWISTGNDSPRLTGQLRQFVEQVRQAVAVGTQLNAVMSQMNASGTDYSAVETYFSLQAGTGRTVNDIVGSAANELATNAFIQGLLSRLG